MKQLAKLNIWLDIVNAAISMKVAKGKGAGNKETTTNDALKPVDNKFVFSISFIVFIFLLRTINTFLKSAFTGITYNVVLAFQKFREAKGST